MIYCIYIVIINRFLLLFSATKGHNMVQVFYMNTKYFEASGTYWC